MKTIVLSAMLSLSAITLFGQSLKRAVTTSVSTSVSISNSDNEYLLSASFTQVNAAQLKQMIADSLGPGIKTGNKDTIWQMAEVYHVKLSPERLTIELNKDKASGSLSRTFVKLGKEINQVIRNNPSAPEPPKTPAN